jgi:hypothetical protein
VRIKAATLAFGFALSACVSANPFAGFDDPRPEGRLSLRERSQCEVPDDPNARWCDYPHEVRTFIERRAGCDHFRGEPWPEGDDAWARERRKTLTDAMRKQCTGTDAELVRLRTQYRDDQAIAAALREFEDDIEP